MVMLSPDISEVRAVGQDLRGLLQDDVALDRISTWCAGEGGDQTDTVPELVHQPDLACVSTCGYCARSVQQSLLRGGLVVPAGPHGMASSDRVRQLFSGNSRTAGYAAE